MDTLLCETHSSPTYLTLIMFGEVHFCFQWVVTAKIAGIKSDARSLWSWGNPSLSNLEGNGTGEEAFIEHSKYSKNTVCGSFVLREKSRALELFSALKLQHLSAYLFGKSLMKNRACKWKTEHPCKLLFWFKKSGKNHKITLFFWSNYWDLHT